VCAGPFQEPRSWAKKEARERSGRAFELGITPSTLSARVRPPDCALDQETAKLGAMTAAAARASKVVEPAFKSRALPPSSCSTIFWYPLRGKWDYTL
jgi:hypothetical protein